MNAAVAEASPARQGMDLKITEKAFQQLVLDYARYRGWRCYHTHNSRRSAPGFPDLVMVRGQRLIFAELKSMRGKLSEAQWQWAEALLCTNGAEVFQWRPNAWRTIEAVLI